MGARLYEMKPAIFRRETREAKVIERRRVLPFRTCGMARIPDAPDLPSDL